MLRRMLIAFLCCLLLVTTVYADNSASGVENLSTVYADGSCQVSLNVTIQLDTPPTGLTFPVPRSAKNVAVNGSSVRTTRSKDSDQLALISLSNLDGMVGSYTMTVSYLLSDVITSQEDKLILEIPLISGFEYPVRDMRFTINLPGEAENKPAFYSGYYQQSIESNLTSNINGNVITGTLTSPLMDRESLSMTLVVSQEMFPSKVIVVREGNPEVVFMGVFAALAFLVWLITMRCWPLIRRYQVSAPDGITAGHVGSCLTMEGADLTTMVLTWANLGYLRLHLDNRGRVFLYKRMDMGNERSAFENRCFSSLFAKSNMVEGTGSQYARLWLRVREHIPGAADGTRTRPGFVKLFRFLAACVCGVCGVCLAMNFTTIPALQILLSLVLGGLGLFLGWWIQAGMYRIHLRNKWPLVVSFTGCALWIFLGIQAGQWTVALWAVLAQLTAGLAAAYGGRRTETGRTLASQVLGLRHYLKTVSNEELRRIMKANPNYFFEMIPYALAMGVENTFAKRFGRLVEPECTYLNTGKLKKRTALDWAELLRHTAELLDARHKEMQREKWMVISIRRR